MALILLILLPVCLAEQNLLKNAGFEKFSDWDCFSCTSALSSDSHSGSHSYKISDRKYEWAGASQELSLTPDRTYYFKAWVKILNIAPGKLYHQMDAALDIKDANDKHKYVACGVTPYVQLGSWHLVGGDYYIPANTKSVRFSIKSPDMEVNFLIDDAEVTWIDHSYKFNQDEDQRIDQLRKADLHISLDGLSSVSGLQVEVKQTTSEFGWGSAVNSWGYLDTNQQPYRDFFFDLFEWAVLETILKWPFIEPTQGQPDFNRSRGIVDELRSKGIKVRGHNIFWGGENDVPKWQKTLTNAQLKSSLVRHIKDMTSAYKGRFEHWDVNNENVHLHYYEEKLQDPDITEWMFREVDKHDPTPKLFLNDYNVVAVGFSTMAYADQAIQFKRKGVPVDVVGVQSHLGPYFDISVMKKRLDELAKVGYPIWITELDIDEPEENKKAQKYSDVLRLYFSHPAVKGVMFWGYSDNYHWRKSASLAHGHDVTPNAAGRKVQELLKKTWRTNETHDISHNNPVNTRAFKGTYQLLVHHNGKVIHTQTFSLTDKGNNLKVRLSGSGSHPHVDHVLIG